MSPRGSHTLLATLALMMSCARNPTLHWQGGDVFGVFETDGSAPSRVECSGTTEARFACFAAKVRERASKVSAVLAVVPAHRGLLEATTTEPSQAAPTTADTPFPLLSVTKMFTAATAVRLSQAGALDLHRPIASYLPELGDNELGRVTVHQLLTHAAGLVDDPRLALCERGGALSEASARAHVGAPPGAVYLYSNLGYSLVGVVIERVTSKPFEDVVRERVLLPMAMSSATFDFASVQVRGHPEGAGSGGRCRLVAPAGGLIASARDVALWARAMSEPAAHPLGQALVEALTQPYVQTGVRPDESYGYGVGITRHGGTLLYSHSGGIQDFSAAVAWVPANRLGAAAMMNASQASGATPTSIVLRGLSVLLDLPADFRPTSEGAPRPIRAYLGTYVDRRSWLGRVRVRRDGENQLAFDYVDGPPALLPPSFTFRFAPGEERARFVVTPVGVAERVADE